jgi:hypothetical protein
MHFTLSKTSTKEKKMKGLLILSVLMMTQIAAAGSRDTRNVTFYPKFNHKRVNKLCYNPSSNDFTYTKKTIFGNIKKKTVSRIYKNVGDCIAYSWTVPNNSNDDDRSMERVCTKKATSTIFYPLTAKVETWEIGKDCTQRGEECVLVRELISSFDYQIKDCQ